MMQRICDKWRGGEVTGPTDRFSDVRSVGGDIREKRTDGVVMIIGKYDKLSNKMDVSLWIWVRLSREWDCSERVNFRVEIYSEKRERSSNVVGVRWRMGIFGNWSVKSLNKCKNGKELYSLSWMALLLLLLVDLSFEGGITMIVLRKKKGNLEKAWVG